MKIAPNLDIYLLFIFLVFPGLVSLHVYKLLMPGTSEIDWKYAPLEALFYSTVNFALTLWIIIPINSGSFYSNWPKIYILLTSSILLLMPIVWPICWYKLVNTDWFQKLHLPYPTTWDYFFAKKETLYVLVHFKNGSKIGGYFGGNSFASAYPREGDIYLEKVIKVDDNGKFLEIIKGSKGVLIKKEEYELIEFFENPNVKM